VLSQQEKAPSDSTGVRGADSYVVERTYRQWSHHRISVGSTSPWQWLASEGHGMVHAARLSHLLLRGRHAGMGDGNSKLLMQRMEGPAFVTWEQQEA